MKCINPNHVNLKEILSNFIKNITYELYSRSTLSKFQKYKKLTEENLLGNLLINIKKVKIDKNRTFKYSNRGKK